MNVADLIWGMVAGYVLLAAVWLAMEKIRRGVRRNRRNDVRSRVAVVRGFAVAGARRRRAEGVPPLRVAEKQH
jgi:bacteriorhodopsin